jgi:hypothetical protein
VTSIVLVLIPIPVDPPRETAPEPDATTEPESDYRYPLGAGLPRAGYPYRTTEAQEAKP